MEITKKKSLFAWHLFYFSIPFVCLFVGRIAFFCYYFSFYSDYSFSALLFNFVHGIRFDLSTVFLLCGIPYFLFLLSPTKLQPFILKGLVLFSLPLSFLLILVQIIGIGYFIESGRHLTFEIFFLFSDFWALVVLALNHYKLLLLLSLFFFALLFYGWFFFFSLLPPLQTRSLYQKKYRTKWFVYFPKVILQRFLLFLLVVFLARGGWQLKPISTTHAFFQGDQKLGNLALSAPFTLTKFLTTFSRRPIAKNWINKKTAIRNTQKLLANEKHTFLSEDYPLYRQTKTTQKKQKRNLVIIIMESWGAGNIAVLEGKNFETTPNFNRLSKKGLLFQNFFATGNRSVQGVSSTLFSLPSIEQLPIYQTPFATNRMNSFASVLGKEGYDSLFFHAGHEGSLYLHNLARVGGYKKVFSIKNLENNKERYDGTWGIWDHFAFQAFAKELDKLTPPFHGVFFSLTSHSPYTIPDEKFNYFSKEKDAPFLNSLRYSDWALGQFMEQAKKYDWYQDSIFLITADHSLGFYEDKKQPFHIPLLIFSPVAGELEGVSDLLGSHIDILPTAFSLLGVESAFVAAGKDLLSSKESYALVSVDNHYWFTPNYIYLFEEDQIRYIFSFADSKILSEDFQKKIHQENREKFLSFFQTNYNAILENKIIP